MPAPDLRLDELRECIGTPWRHQGRNPKVGLDCIGLTRHYVRLRGFMVRVRDDYNRDPDGSLWAGMCATFGQPIASGRNCVAKGRPGDISMMEYSFGAHRHVGVLADAYGLSMIHADSNVGRVVEIPIDARWARRIVGVWRLPA